MFIVISGPSGAGKTPIIYRMLEVFPNLRRIQSYTTRKNREREVEGTYIYLTASQFEEKIKKGFFLEYNKVHKDQQYYGTGLDSYKSAVDNGYVAIKDIDVDSYKQIKQKGLDVIGVYITVKNRSILFDRLRERGESEHTINLRLTDRVDYENAQKQYYDYVVYTDNYEDACKQMEKIVDTEFKKRAIKVKKYKGKFKTEHMF